MSSLAAFRLERSVTLEQLALGLGLAVNSKGHLSRIENGEPAGLRLALKIHRFSAGVVSAEDLVNDEDRGLLRDFRAICAKPEGAAA